MTTPFYLTLKEIWRNRGRFLLFSLVIALITLLVLFIAALADGLGNGNREYIEKLNGELIVYKSNVDLSIGASRLDRSQLRAIVRVPGVKDAGQASFSSVVLLQSEGKKFNVALIGVEPGKPGEPPVVLGRGLGDKSSSEAIIDRNVALRTGYTVGDQLRLKAIQGTQEEFYDLRIVGISDGRQYSLQPSVIVSHPTFDRVKPGVPVVNATDLVSNLIIVQLDEPLNWKAMAITLANQVEGIQAVDRQTAYQNTPGYSAQQSTLDTQRFFTLLIGVLVIGGFFQIQTLQKVPQIGMLKAIGAPNLLIAIAALTQIVLVTILGVSIGALATVLLSFTFPATIPIVFSPMAIVIGVASLMLVGPIGGLVSVRYALRVEPLTALGLTG
ncbi:MAG: FtsX-like permease family protein [Chloroflexi bacterium]|nr:FtsX-like permease family protein [Chloroflexota bacterium]